MASMNNKCREIVKRLNVVAKTYEEEKENVQNYEVPFVWAPFLIFISTFIFFLPGAFGKISAVC